MQDEDIKGWRFCSDAYSLDLLDDEKLTKMGLLVSSLKMRYSKSLNEHINSNDRDYQLLQEKLSIDENIVKKIREIKRRKVTKHFLFLF